MSKTVLSQISQTDNRWNLSGDVLVTTATALLENSKNLSINAETIIDFAQVQNIDTSTISLILEWKRRAIRESQTIKLANLPANLTSLAELYGVAELIN